jgi:hypothetical protein
MTAPIVSATSRLPLTLRQMTNYATWARNGDNERAYEFDGQLWERFAESAR